MNDSVKVEEILAHVNRDQLIQDVLDMTNILSPTGSEGAMGDWMENRYKDMGLDVIRQEVEPGRPNIFGILRGEGDGPTLQFDGHLDVSFTGKEDFMRGGASSDFARLDTIDGEEWILGAGSYNMKAAHGAYIACVEAIQKSGVKLKGDIMLSATSGEIECNQIDDFQGSYYRGNGAGASHAASHGIVPDFAILGEPTELNLMIGHFGSFWTKVTIGGGTVMHTAFSDDSENVIEKMTVVIDRFSKFKKEFAAKTQYKNYCGKVNIASIQGGRPWKSSRTPDAASLYMDIRYPPGWTPLKIKAEIDRVLWELKQEHPDLQIKQQPFSTNPPTEVQEDDYIVGAVQRAHKAIFNNDTKTIYNLWYSNAPPLNAMGAQALNYGSAGSRRIKGLTLSDKDREYVHVNDLFECSKVYVMAALDICTKTRAEVRPDLI